METNDSIKKIIALSHTKGTEAPQVAGRQCLRLPPFCVLFCSHLSYVIQTKMLVINEGFYVIFTIRISVNTKGDVAGLNL
jgi:hypothetical protein